MSTKVILKSVGKLFRASVTGLLLASLFVSGATAAKRSYLEDQKRLKKEAASAVSPDAELATPPISDEANGSMARGAHPTTEQVCILTAGITPLSNHSQNLRLRDSAPLDFIPTPTNSGALREQTAATSLALAAPITAATRTLVGAVPSGTM